MASAMIGGTRGIFTRDGANGRERMGLGSLRLAGLAGWLAGSGPPDLHGGWKWVGSEKGRNQNLVVDGVGKLL